MNFRDTCHGSPKVGAADERTGPRQMTNSRQMEPLAEHALIWGTSRTAAISGRAGVREAPGRTVAGSEMPSQMEPARTTYPPAERLARIPTPSPLAKNEKTQEIFGTAV